MNESKVLDIESEEETLINSDRYIRGLDAGIHALVLDYNFHIKETFTEHRIYDVRGSISYRLNSSRFHFHLLFNELVQIRKKHNELLINSDPKNSPDWHLELDKRHLSYILDSIIFHLSSIFDYTAILISVIISKKESTPNWMKIESSARAGSNIFESENTSHIKKSVVDIHNNFVRALYDYRSDLIHRTADILRGSYAWNLMTNQKTLLFLCSKMQRRTFKKLGEKDKEISVTYFVHYLIFQTIESIAELIRTLRNC